MANPFANTLKDPASPEIEVVNEFIRDLGLLRSFSTEVFRFCASRSRFPIFLRKLTRRA
jgi:hypothetical protein